MKAEGKQERRESLIYLIGPNKSSLSEYAHQPAEGKGLAENVR